MGTKILDATLSYTKTNLDASPTTIKLPLGKTGVTDSINTSVYELAQHIIAQVSAGSSLVTTKGDLVGFSTVPDRFPAPVTNGLALLSDSAEAFGFKWAAVSGSGNVVNNDAVTDEAIALFNGTSGTVIKGTTTTIASLTSSLNSTAQGYVTAHSGLTNNPHSVTAAQVDNGTAQWNANKLYGSSIDSSVGSATDGKILVFRSAGNDWVLEDKPASGSNPALNDISDVNISTVSNYQVLGYYNGSWVNQTISTGSGTVTTVSVVTANGVSGSVATATTTPAITLTLGAITPSSVASTGAISGTTISGTTLNMSSTATATKFNNLTLTAASVGFTIAGGTTSKTLTVPLDATVSGTNTGDQNYTTNIYLANEASDTTCFPVFVTGATGELAPKTNSGFIYNSSTNTLQTTVLKATGEITSYSSSDKNLKVNINTLTNATDIINTLRPITFNWNETAKKLNSSKDNRLNYGLIAQEVLSTLPELVHSVYDIYKGIDYEQIIAILIKANQEQDARIKVLESKL